MQFAWLAGHVHQRGRGREPVVRALSVRTVFSGMRNELHKRRRLRAKLRGSMAK